MGRKRKAANGTGGISKRRDGLYVGRVTVGWEVVDGQRKQVRRAVYGRTIADVQAKLVEVQAQHQAGALPAQRGREKTLAQFSAEWLITAARHVRPTTLHRYRQLLDHHILPTLGRTPLTKLSVDQVDRLLADRRRRGRRDGGPLSPRSCNYLRGALRTLLREAERRGLVTRNVAALARPLPQPRKEPAVLSAEQAHLVLEAAQHDSDGPLWVLGLTTGARASEMLGLRWSDVDLDAGEIRIEQTMQEAPAAIREEHGRWLVQPPKTPKSRRGVPLPAIAVEALRQQRARQNTWRLAAGPRWANAGLVFTDQAGRPLAVTTVSKRWTRHTAPLTLPASTQARILELRGAGATLAEISERLTADGVSPGRGVASWSPTRVARAIGLPAVRFHAATRHSVASFLLAAGVPMKTVSELLGHSQLATTSDVYSHVAKALKRDAADALGRVLGG